jgi:hypothetical protein
MRTSVEIIQVSDLSWYLRISAIDEAGVVIVNTLIPFKRYIYAEQTAQLLQLHVDNVKEYQWVG